MRVDVVVVFCVAAVFLFLPTPSTCEPLCVMSAPNLLRVGTAEKVFVEAQDYRGSSPLQVNILISAFPSKLEILTKTVTLTPEGNFQHVAEVNIETKFFANAEKEYVYLRAEFPKHVADKNVLEKLVLLSFQSGYIFLQTDKTIYTPSSTVNYRIFALNPDFKPTNRSVQVDIRNQDGISMKDSEAFAPQQNVITKSYTIPEFVRYGTWSINARFSDSPQNHFSTMFEVKEYVLPSFEIVLTPKKQFYYVDEDKLEVDIKARYLYGKDVKGMAFVIFGVLINGQKRSLPDSLQRAQIMSGKGSATLMRQHILKIFPEMTQIVQSSIYVHVSVLTESASEMVEAEKRGIQIVKSPYTIQFKRTPKYFKPGMPFDVKVYVSNPDGSPAAGIPVQFSANDDKSNKTTLSNGMAKLTLNTQSTTTLLEIQAKTMDTMLTHERQSSQSMTASPYQSKSGSQNYLHINVPAEVQHVGGQISMTLNSKNNLKEEHGITVLILSRGQIIEATSVRRQGQSVLSVDLPVIGSMLPSFRIVAYYHIGSEVVSDSVWVDVKNTCMGKLEIKSDDEITTLKPRGKLKLIITGDPGATVGLVAVDKGVYVLNNKHRLTQSKIWGSVEKFDTGCTAGSGNDSMGVFYDAGLLFETSAAEGTTVRTASTCEAQAKRRRRAVTIMEVQTTAVKNYTGEARQCCVDGMKKNMLGYSCKHRAEFILDGEECKAAFLKCCGMISKHHEEEKEDILQLARSETEEEDLDDLLQDVTLRSKFEESWLWRDFKLNSDGTPTTHTEFFPDSITSWQISAISLSSTKGICVADTQSLEVKLDFFIDLKLPYSAVRNEQIEIRAIIHNNVAESLKVRVELYHTQGVCSAAAKSGKIRTIVQVDEKSTYAVPFVIIPIGDADSYSIEVKAISAGLGGIYADGIEKTLRIVNEGVRKIVPQTIVLDPSKSVGGKQRTEIFALRTEDKLLRSKGSTRIIVQGDDLGLTIEKAISGDFMESLIKQPSGCAEQNMAKTTMPVIAAHYLDKTKQWDTVGFDKREKAIHFINDGYHRQLSYRKPDGYFAVYENSRPGTWLTAYVAKVFSMASDIISVNETVICTAFQWLFMNRQQPNGVFTEEAVLRYIDHGDIFGVDSQASITAFVLIAMQEGYRICQQIGVGSLQARMELAVQYLKDTIDNLSNPYAVAMASYALANADITEKKSIIFKFLHPDGTHWPVRGNHLLTIEATAYALLALVKMGEFEKAGPVVNWLSEQRQSMGGYWTTQPTIMVFQALVEYRTKARVAPDKNLEVEVSVLGRSTAPTKYSWNKENTFQTRSNKFQLNENLLITATGKGKGTIFVEHIYYAAPTERSVTCKKFNLTVSLERKVEDKVVDQALETYVLTIDVQFMSNRNATNMPILDVSLPTGFQIHDKDLRQLMDGKDRYIQRFERNNKLSERGSYVIYLPKISHQRPDRIAFRLNKVMNVGLIQPAAVTVYEYYKKDESCVKFYRPEMPHGELKKLCLGDVCECAEAMCSKQRNTDVEVETRGTKACEIHVDYVIKGTVENIDYSATTDIFRIKVDDVLKLGTDRNMTGQRHETRLFIAHPACRESMDLHLTKSYLIMGAKKDVHRVGDSYQFVLGEKTWIEYWPTEMEAQQPEFNSRFVELDEFAFDLTNGCSH